MDYLFLSGLLGTALLILNISYDICCQWSINLWTRMAVYPEPWRVDTSRTKWTYLVPKFHLPAHVEKCQTAYSFNYTRGVGRTDGEAPERGWADINAAASSTKEMGPGSRRDTLDDHFGDWNHKKIVAMGKYLNFIHYHLMLTCILTHRSPNLLAQDQDGCATARRPRLRV